MRCSYPCYAWTLAVLASCSGVVDDGSVEPVGLLPQGAAAARSILLVDGSGDRAFELEVSGDGPARLARTAAIPGRPLLIEERQGDAIGEAIVLSSDRDLDRSDSSSYLSVLRRGKDPVDYALFATHEQVRQSPDGAFAVVFGTGLAAGAVFDPDAIAVVDLTVSPGAQGAVRRASMPACGSPLHDVFMSGAIGFEDGAHHFAVGLFEGCVAIMDLDSEGLASNVVLLSATTSQSRASAVEVVAGASPPTLYVRSEADARVTAIKLPRRADEAMTVYDALLGAAAADLAVCAGKDADRLLAIAPGSGALYVFDASSQLTRSIELGFAATRVDVACDSKARAIAAVSASGLDLLAFVELDSDVADVDVRQLSGVPEYIAVSGDTLVLAHAGGADVVDISERDVQAFATMLAAAPTLVAIDSDIWFGTAGANWVSVVRGSSRTVESVDTGSPIQQIFAMRDAKRLAVVHDARSLYVSLFALDDLTRPADTTRLFGMALEVER